MKNKLNQFISLAKQAVIEFQFFKHYFYYCKKKNHVKILWLVYRMWPAVQCFPIWIIYELVSENIQGMSTTYSIWIGNGS